MSDLEFHRDGRVTLRNPDPIIEKVVGYERFYLSAARPGLRRDTRTHPATQAVGVSG